MIHQRKIWGVITLLGISSCGFDLTTKNSNEDAATKIDHSCDLFVNQVSTVIEQYQEVRNQIADQCSNFEGVSVVVAPGTFSIEGEDDVFFIDEIHRLSRVVEEVLYPAMEDFFVTWVIDKGLKARSMNLSLKPFTLIGATTRYGMISSPLRDRFGSIHRLGFYTVQDMEQILLRSARILDIAYSPDGLHEIAKRARGTPRVANRLLRRVRDYAQVVADNIITQDVALKALTDLKIDDLGLDGVDINVVKCIIEKFDGGPVGIDTIAASINEESETIEDVYEPYLIQMGFLDRTQRGRVATRRAYEHLGYEFNKPSSSRVQSRMEL